MSQKCHFGCSRLYFCAYIFFQGLAFVTMMILRCADFYPGTGGQSQDDGILINFVVFAFFYIVLVQLIGILLGDRSPIQVSKHDLELSKMGFANSRRKNVSRNENANGQGGEKKRNASKHSRSVPRSEGWGKRMPRERKIDRSRGPARRKGAERRKKHARSAISARGKATTGITRKQTQSLRPSSPGSDIDMEKMLAKMIKHKRSLLSKLQATMADNA